MLSRCEELSAEEVEEVERLDRVLKMDAELRWRSWSRLGAILILGVAFLAAGILATWSRSQTEFNADLRAGRVQFELKRARTLTHDLHLDQISITGVASVVAPTLPRARDLVRRHRNRRNRLLLTRAKDDRSKISLAGLRLPPEATVDVRVEKRTQRIRLRVKNDSEEGWSAGLTLTGDFAQLSETNIDRELVTLHFPPRGTVDLALQLSAPQEVFQPSLEMQAFSFSERRDLSYREDVEVVEYSSILSGSITLRELNGETFELAAGSELRTSGFGGFIRRLEVTDGALQVQVVGVTRELEVGYGDYRSSLVPSQLEWIRARKPLALMWGTGVWLFGLIIAVGRWFLR